MLGCMRTPAPAEREAIGRAYRAARATPGRPPRTQTDVAEAIGVDQTVVSRIENGQLGPRSFVTLMALSAELGVNPAWVSSFFFDTPSETTGAEVTELAARPPRRTSTTRTREAVAS